MITTVFSRTMTGMVPNYFHDYLVTTYDRTEPMLGSWALSVLHDIVSLPTCCPLCPPHPTPPRRQLHVHLACPTQQASFVASALALGLAVQGAVDRCPLAAGSCRLERVDVEGTSVRRCRGPGSHFTRIRQLDATRAQHATHGDGSKV